MKCSITLKYPLVLILLCLSYVSAASQPSMIAGQIADSEGTAVADARVLIHSDSSGGTVGLHDNIGIQQDVIVMTDANGKYSASVPAGFYDLFVSSMAFTPITAKVRVRQGQRITFDGRLVADPLVTKELGHKIYTTPEASQEPFGGMKLIDGYSIQQGSAVDAIVWTIERKGGTRIECESGPNEDSWADPKAMNQYTWYKEQVVNGYTIRFALIKTGLQTVWEPQDSKQHLGNILLVTFLLSGEDSSNTANFKAKITSPSDLADVLLMVLTFDPSKG